MKTDAFKQLDEAIKEAGENVKRQAEILERIKEFNRAFNNELPIVGGDGSC